MLENAYFLQMQTWFHAQLDKKSVTVSANGVAGSSALHRSSMSLKNPFDTQKLFKCKTIQKPGSCGKQAEQQKKST